MIVKKWLCENDGIQESVVQASAADNLPACPVCEGPVKPIIQNDPRISRPDRPRRMVFGPRESRPL